MSSVHIVGDFMVDVVQPYGDYSKALLSIGGAGTVLRCVESFAAAAKPYGWLQAGRIPLSVRNGVRHMLGIDESVYCRESGVGSCHVRWYITEDDGMRASDRFDWMGDLSATVRYRNEMLACAIQRAGREDILVYSDFNKLPHAHDGKSVDTELLGSREGITIIASKSDLFVHVAHSMLVIGFEDIHGRLPSSAAELRDAAFDVARQRGGPTLLTGAKWGATLVEGHVVQSVSAPQVRNSYVVGAGDWLVGALAAALARGFDLPAAVEMSVCEASRSVAHCSIGGSHGVIAIARK